MFTAMVAAYPWDLLDEGLDNALGRLSAEVGIQHVSLWAAAPETSYVRARQVEPRWVYTAGGLAFAPDRERYQATRLRPAVAAGLKGKDAFATIVAACEKSALTVSTVISASRTGGLARRHPECACKNAWGDASLSCVCLNHPDVRAYLVALVEDLTARFPVEWVELADFFTVFGEAERWPLSLPAGAEPAVRRLLGLCFCESCRHGAAEDGVAVDAAARWAAEAVQQTIDGKDVGARKLLDRLAQPPLADFLDWTAGKLNQLLIRLAKASARPLVLHCRAGDVGRFEHERLDGSLLEAVILWAETPETVPEAPSSHVLPPGPSGLPAKPVTGAARFIVNAPHYGADDRFPGSFIAFYSRAAEAGAAGVRIEDYYAWPATAFDVMRRAVRIWRRSEPGGAAG